MEGGVVGVGTIGVAAEVAVAGGVVGVGKGLVGTTDWGIAAVAGGVAVASRAVGVGKTLDGITVSGGTGVCQGAGFRAHDNPTRNKRDTASTIICTTPCQQLPQICLKGVL